MESCLCTVESCQYNIFYPDCLFYIMRMINRKELVCFPNNLVDIGFRHTRPDYISFLKELTKGYHSAEERDTKYLCSKPISNIGKDQNLSNLLHIIK